MDAKRTARAWLAGLAVVSAALSPGGARDVLSLNGGWRFLNADVSGAEQPGFDDSRWTPVELPHDWSMAGPFAQTNAAGGAGAFLPAGVAWYRQRFWLPDHDLERRVFVEFDGVMQNSDVWINGMHLGHRPNGCVGFRYELPGVMLNYGRGTTNVLTVCADASAQPAWRWHAGSGICRHVRLLVTDPVHIAADGLFVSTPKISSNQATVLIETTVTNESAAPREFSLQTSLLAPDGEPVGAIASSESVEAGAAVTLDQPVVFASPQLWSPAEPRLYQLVSQVRVEKRIADEQTTTFGIREARFEAGTGFWLNGKNIKLKGVCLHADAGAFGAAAPLAIWESRLKTLKSLGVNSVRTAHNPPAPEFLDLCDRLGLLVLDEFFDCWSAAKEPCDYHLYFNDWSERDERDTIRRDRNHPSVIMYSLGNEIRETAQPESAKKILAALVAVARAADPTRPVTLALFRPNASHDYDDGLADLLDVVGQNYREDELLAAHEQKPSRKILGTENAPDRRSWLAVRDHAALAGEFLWTGIDYLGESRGWPMVGRNSGLLDRTGAIRPLAREIQSWWTEEPMVAMARRVSPTRTATNAPAAGQSPAMAGLFSDWTPADLKPHTEAVEVYSNCKLVELFLNGKSLGRKTINTDASPRAWQVAFAPGILRAVGRDDGGRPAVTNELHTTGEPVRIALTADTKKLSPVWDDVARVRATVMDSRGITLPRAADLITFKLTGPGEIAAVDNGDNASHEPFQAAARHAYQGGCVAFVRAKAAGAKAGIITLTASAAGLKPGSIVIKTTSAP